MQEKIWYLKNCQLFESLTTEQVQHLEARSRIRKFPGKNPVYLPAQQADGVMFLASGRVKVCSFTPDGKQSILAFIDPGEIFGEMAIFDGAVRDDYVETVEPSTIILMPADAVRSMVEAHPEISLGVIKLIGLRRQKIERRLKYLLFHSNREKLIHLLWELSEQYGRTVDGGIELGIKLSHQELANIIGATRETVTVTLGRLQTEGLVTMGRRKIVIRNVDKMAAAVGAPPKRADKGSSQRNSPAIGPLSGQKAAGLWS